jgi:hypothetical protein
MLLRTSMNNFHRVVESQYRQIESAIISNTESRIRLSIFEISVSTNQSSHNIWFFAPRRNLDFLYILISNNGEMFDQSMVSSNQRSTLVIETNWNIYKETKCNSWHLWSCSWRNIFKLSTECHALTDRRSHEHRIMALGSLHFAEDGDIPLSRPIR